MNHSIQKTLLVLFLAAGAFSLKAQKHIAHINVDSLISMMPETKTASAAAEAISNSLNQEMIAMQTEFETRYNDYLKNEATMSDLMKKTKQDDLRQLEQRTADFRTQAQQEYQAKTAELTLPIMEKAKKAIAAVAKETGYKYVLNTSPQTTTVLYSDPADDILMLVKKKLDTMPPAVIPGAPKTNAETTPAGGPKTTPAKGK